MRNLFTGSLGKISHIGGSRIYTTPNTVEVSGTSYEISARVQGEFVTHSLDGRLWIYQRGTRYGMLALKFKSETEKLEFATSRTITLTNERILARGLDWILTSKNIYMVSDESPYIFSASLYDSNIPEKYLYSILRSGVNSEKPSGFSVNVGSGVDPFTKEAWGKSETNGNSDGSGYFSRDTELLKLAGSFVLDKSYSVLPSVGDWQILPNFLLRRPDAALNESYNGQKNLRPLIPLEFNLYSDGSAYPSYGCGYEHDISLAMIDGELWARGFSHIGKVKILPAVFSESGEVEEYYLYISPEYPCSPFDEKASLSLNANDDWLKLKIAKFGGYLSEQSNSLSDGLVETSDDTRIFSLQAKEYSEQLPEESAGKFYVDVLNSKGLILHDNGAKFFNGADYECRGLSQWLAPGGKVESISDDSVVSSIDGGLLNTSIQTGFNRQLLRVENPIMTAKNYAGSRLILSEYEVSGRKSFHVNKFQTPNENISGLDWEGVYKEPIKINQINIAYIDTDWLFFVSEFENYYSIRYSIFHTGMLFYNGDREDKYYYGLGGINNDGNYIIPNIPSNVSEEIFYIDPETGELKWPFIISSDIPTGYICPDYCSFHDGMLGFEMIGYHYVGKMGYGIDINNNNEFVENPPIYKLTENSSYFKAVCSIPDVVQKWVGNNNLSDKTVIVFQKAIFPSNLSSSVVLVFCDTLTNTKFYVNAPSLGYIDETGDFTGILSLNSYCSSESLSYVNIENYKIVSHVIIFIEENQDKAHYTFVTFHTYYDPSQLDFKAELIRSEKI